VEAHVGRRGASGERRGRGRFEWGRGPPRRRRARLPRPRCALRRSARSLRAARTSSGDERCADQLVRCAPRGPARSLRAARTSSGDERREVPSRSLRASALVPLVARRGARPARCAPRVPAQSSWRFAPPPRPRRVRGPLGPSKRAQRALRRCGVTRTDGLGERRRARLGRRAPRVPARLRSAARFRLARDGVSPLGGSPRAATLLPPVMPATPRTGRRTVRGLSAPKAPQVAGVKGAQPAERGTSAATLDAEASGALGVRG
jgi:hypothetical protein